MSREAEQTKITLELRRHLNEARYCLVKTYSPTPAEIRVDFTINQGVAKDVRFGGDPAPSPATSGCIDARLRAWAFPGVAVAEVAATYRFDVAQDR